MPSLNIAVLGEDASARANAAAAMAKKSTVDDLGFYHTVFQGKIVNVVDAAAYPAKPSALLQAINLSDWNVVVAGKLSPSLGETIVALDFLGAKAVFVSDSVDFSPLLSKTASLAQSKVFTDFEEAKNFLLSQESAASSEGAAVTLADHCFEVKGVGTIVLGFVKRGTARVHDEFVSHPGGKRVSVRSIQMNDADVGEAPAGSRVGFALKGAESKDVRRGAVFAKPDDASVKTVNEFDCVASVAKFARQAIENEAALHLAAGLQFEPCAVRCAAPIVPGKSGKARVVVDKPIALDEKQKMVLCDLNARGLRVLASVIASVKI